MANMETPTLRTDRFVIRAFETKDLEPFTRYRANPEVARYQSWSNYTYRNAETLIGSMDYSRFGVTGNWYQLAVADIDSDELLGDIAVHFLDDDQIEIGFTVAPEYQRKSVAFEAVSRFLAYIFGDLKRHRVTATTDVKNKPSFRLLEKLGFRREAHFIQNIFFKGAWGDEFQYALLRSEQNYAQ
jgi:RimJ/RimL family protein N-acetyltransferase